MMSAENPASQSAGEERKLEVICGGHDMGEWYSGGDPQNHHIYVKNNTGAAVTVSVQLQLYDADWRFKQQVQDGPSIWNKDEGRNMPDFPFSGWNLPSGHYFEKVYIYGADGQKIHVNECAWQFDI